MRKIWRCAAAVLFAGGLVNVVTQSADAAGRAAGRAAPATATSASASATTPTGLLRAATAERRRVCQRGQAHQRQWLHLAST
ncbi:MAG: hypothetical protein ACXWEI_12220 [Mycobacterium sp.]